MATVPNKRRAESPKRKSKRPPPSFADAIGLETGSSALDYIRLSDGEKETLTNSLAYIQKSLRKWLRRSRIRQPATGQWFSLNGSTDLNIYGPRIERFAAPGRAQALLEKGFRVMSNYRTTANDVLRGRHPEIRTHAGPRTRTRPFSVL